jgi:hypothetical protein
MSMFQKPSCLDKLSIFFNCSFAWYSWAYYEKHTAGFPNSKMNLGRYLGPTNPEAGSVLFTKIVTFGHVIRHNMFRHLKPLENEKLELSEGSRYLKGNNLKGYNLIGGKPT